MGIGWAMQQIRFNACVTRPAWDGWLQGAGDADNLTVQYVYPNTMPVDWAPLNDDMLATDWEIANLG